MAQVSPLSGWLNRRHSLPKRFYADTTADQTSQFRDCWVSIEEKIPFHHADAIEWISLKESQEKTDNHLMESSEQIRGLEGAWLDSEEAIMIQEELGAPPPPCFPMYIIGLEGKGNLAGPVYVGITRSNNRFKGGHKAALLLHDPIYENYKKFLYRAAIWFYHKDEYLPLEWLRPDKVAHDILNSIESQLIYSLNPIFNKNKKKTDCARLPLNIHIQNFTEDNFLKDNFVFPSA